MSSRDRTFWDLNVCDFVPAHEKDISTYFDALGLPVDHELDTVLVFFMFARAQS
jgi:hypothetical protein